MISEYLYQKKYGNVTKKMRFLILGINPKLKIKLNKKNKKKNKYLLK